MTTVLVAAGTVMAGFLLLGVIVAVGLFVEPLFRNHLAWHALFAVPILLRHVWSAIRKRPSAC